MDAVHRFLESPAPSDATRRAYRSDLRPFVMDLLSGELRTVGVDVASLRTRSDPPATIYVPMDAVSQVSFRP